VLIEGKVVLVTGAGRGIGRGLSIDLARRGARVALAGLHQEELCNLQAQIAGEGGQAIAVACDVREEALVRQLMQDVLAVYGKIDILINNAGITLGGDLRLLSDQDWERALSVNLWSVIRLVRAVLPHMLERGSGYIVNIASAAGLVAPALWIPYSTSKFAVVGFSEGLCAAFRAKGVGVSVVCPMWVQTDLLKRPPPRLAELHTPRATPTNRRLARPWGWLIGHLPGRQITVEMAAQRIIRGIEREQFLVYTHSWTRLLVLARAIAPQTFSRLWDLVNAVDEERHRISAPEA
jgi:NAD(P)-dependent dehydrogenase (short-subunit alcohol dehydrogenase family)